MNDDNIQYKIQPILKQLHIASPILLGKGGEGLVYEYGNDAIKIYPHILDIQYLKSIQNFQHTLSKYKFSFDVPQVYEVDQINGVLYTIEKRLKGIQMDQKIINLNTTDRQKVYKNYYDAIRQIHAITFPTLPYGNIIKTTQSINSDSWTDYLIKVLIQKTTKTHSSMAHRISNYDQKIETMKLLIKKYLLSNQKCLIHCDYFLNNVLVNDSLDISAILDFSQHSAVGDPKLDIASVLTWNEIDPNVKQEDYIFLYDVAKKDYGDEIITYADLYLLFSSFYFADMEDPNFSMKHLNDNKLWSKYS